MFDKLARLFTRPADVSSPVRRHLAMAVMLAETARADYEDDPAERRAIEQMLTRSLDMGAAEARQLVAEAFDESREAVSLHRFLRVLNDELDAAGKCELLTWLWRVAYADGRLEPLEEARVRQIAELLFVPHSDFIRLRMQVEDEVRRH